jgi:hypothetical protein
MVVGLLYRGLSIARTLDGPKTREFTVKRVWIWRVAAFTASAAVLMTAMAASAALPTPNKAKIVPFKSVGPVKFGTTKDEAVAKWGEPVYPNGDPACGTEAGGQTTCMWFASSSDFPVEAAGLQLGANGKVCGVLIRAGTKNSSGELTITGLKRWKTEEGVGLGSSLRAAKRVLGGTLVAEKHGVTTAFSAGHTPASDKQVEGIRIHKAGCNVT